MKLQIQKLFSHVKDYNLFILIGIIALVPFFTLSFFNNPATDDFFYAYYVKLYSIHEAPFWFYNNLGGRYFSNTLLSFSPIYFGCTYWYKIIPILLLSLFCFSLYTFVSSFFETMSFRKKTAIVGLLLSLFLFQLPDACSAFYWMPGSITYQLPISLNLLAFALIIRFYTSKKVVFLLMAIIALFSCIGCNEITVIFNLLFFYFIIFYRFFALKKIDITMLVLCLFVTAFGAFEILAPGNVVRGKAIPVQHDLLYSLSHAIIASINYWFKWLPLVMIVSLFFVQTIYKKIKLTTNKSVFIHPILAFLMLFSILVLELFPGFWVNHDILPDRAINTIYFYFILSVGYWMVCLLHYLKEKYHFIIELNLPTKYAMGCIIVLIMFSNTPIYKAYYDLVNKKAYHYNQEMVHRINIIETSKDKTVVVPALKSQPESIFKPIIMGLTTNKNDWKNQETSDYFNKEIVVQPTDSVFTE